MSAGKLPETKPDDFERRFVLSIAFVESFTLSGPISLSFFLRAFCPCRKLFPIMCPIMCMWRVPPPPRPLLGFLGLFERLVVCCDLRPQVRHHFVGACSLDTEQLGAMFDAGFGCRQLVCANERVLAHLWAEPNSKGEIYALAGHQYFRRFNSRGVPGRALNSWVQSKSLGLSFRPKRFSRQPMHKHPPKGSIPAFSQIASRTV